MLKNIETIWLTELNLSQFSDVKLLLASCEKNDKGGPLIYSNSLLSTRLPPVNGLIYFQHKLIAFISAYFFYKTACECSLMVSPDYRKQGLAKFLLEKLIPVLKLQHMEAVYFSASPSFPTQEFSQLSFYACEYQLTLSLSQPLNEISHRLNFRSANMEDIEKLLKIDQACFANYDAETMIQRFKDTISSPHYHIFVGELEGKIIAKAHIKWHQQEAILSDIAVLPAYQRRGYGSEIVHACLIETQQRGFKHVLLEVESDNKSALKLYLNHGFKVEKETNFWKMKI